MKSNCKKEHLRNLPPVPLFSDKSVVKSVDKVIVKNSNPFLDSIDLFQYFYFNQINYLKRSLKPLDDDFINQVNDLLQKK